MKPRMVLMTMCATTLFMGAAAVQASPPPDLWELVTCEPVHKQPDKGVEGQSGRHVAGGCPDPAMGTHPGHRHGGQPGGPPEMMPPPPPLAGLAKSLISLSEAQRREIAAMLRGERDKALPLLKKKAELHERLEQVERGKRFDDGAVRTLAREMTGLEAELIVARARAHSRIRDILTPVQREIAEKLEREMAHGPGPHPAEWGPR